MDFAADGEIKAKRLKTGANPNADTADYLSKQDKLAQQFLEGGPLHVKILDEFREFGMQSLLFNQRESSPTCQHVQPTSQPAED
jgi:hypothetical protein